MKNKKVLGGLVAAAVLLSGTTVLYFAGVERVGVAPANAVPPGRGDAPPIMEVGGGGDCADAGGFCADNLGMGGGCQDLVCCPPGANWCAGTSSYEPIAFREVGSNPNGTCWKYSTNKVPYCHRWVCSGSTICPALCQTFGTSIVLTRTAPQEISGSCLPKW